MRKINIFRCATLIFTLIISFFLYHQRQDFHNPFTKDFSILSPSYCTTDINNNTYIIDNSTTRIVRLNSNSEVTLMLHAISNSTKSFYNARSLAVDSVGNIYVSDMQLDESGIYVSSERVLQYSSLGQFKKILYEVSYPLDDPNRPRLKGLLTDLKIIDNHLYFSQPYDEALNLIQINLDDYQISTLGSIAYPDADILISDAEITDDFSYLYCCRKDGIIERYKAISKDAHLNFSSSEIVYQGTDTDNELSIPWGIALSEDNTLYFTDIGTRQILRIDTDNQVKTFLPARYQTDSSLSIGNSPIFNRICVGENDSIATTDTFNILILNQENTILLDTNQVSYHIIYRIYSFLLWIFLIFSALVYLALVLFILGHVRTTNLEGTQKSNILIVVTSIIIATIVSNLLISNNTQTNDSEVSQNVLTLANMASSLIDGDKFKEFEHLSDFHNEGYSSLKDTMDSIMNSCNEAGNNPYYIFYRTDGEQVYDVMDYSNTAGTIYPMDTAYKDSYYEEVLTSGEPQLFDSFQDSTGIWTLAVAPIYDSDGNPVAVIELGRNTLMYKIQQQNQILTIILSVLVLVVIMILIFNEAIQFIAIFGKRIAGKAISPNSVAPVMIIRPLAFCLLISDFMQNAFEPIYVTQLYTPLFNLPQNIVISIALSAEVFSVSIFSFVAGKLRKNLRLKPMLYAGSILAAFGFALRGFAPNIPIFIVGKLITGVGMGFVFVALNTFIAERADEKEINQGFTGYYASYLAAINVGIVLGSTLAEKLNYKTVYYISALFMIICTVFIAYMVKENLDGSIITQKKETAKSSFFHFFFNRKILGFFLFFFIPYLIASYFLYYFFPLYANSMGMSDSKIGQTYLINGLCVIYLGPILAPFIIRRIGNRLTILLGGFLCVAGMCFFAWTPSIPTALFCILLMGIADSISFTAATLYYNEQEAVSEYGISPATGIKESINNLGTTIAPFVFSSLLLNGTSFGIASIAAGFAILLGLFALLSHSKKQ